MKKKIISVLVAAMILVVTAIPAFASTDVNQYEQQVLDKLNAGVAIGGSTLKLSSFYNSAYNYFLQSDVISSQADADAIIGAVNDAGAKLHEYKVTVTGDGQALDTTGVESGVTGTQIKTAVLEIINTAADPYDMTAEFNPTSKVFTITDNNGTVVATNNIAIRSTGASNMVLPIVLGSVFAVALIGASVYVFKNKKVAE